MDLVSLIQDLFMNIDFIQNLLSEMVGIVVTIFGVNFVIKRFEAKRSAYLRTKAIQRADDILKKPLSHVHSLLWTGKIKSRDWHVVDNPADDFDFFASYDPTALQYMRSLSDNQIGSFIQVFVNCLENIESLFAQFQTILTNQDLRMLLSLTDHLDTYITKVRFASQESAAINLQELQNLMMEESEASLDATVNRIHRTKVYCRYRLVEEEAGIGSFAESRQIWRGVDKKRYKLFMSVIKQSSGSPWANWTIEDRKSSVIDDADPTPEGKAPVGERDPDS